MFHHTLVQKPRKKSFKTRCDCNLQNVKWEYFIFIVVVVYLSGELNTALPSTMVQPTINIPPSALPSTSLQPTIHIPPVFNQLLIFHHQHYLPPSALPSTSLQPTVNITPPALPSTTRPEHQSILQQESEKDRRKYLQIPFQKMRRWMENAEENRLAQEQIFSLQWRI